MVGALEVLRFWEGPGDGSLRKRRGLGSLFSEIFQLQILSLAVEQPAPSLSHAHCHHPY